MSLKTYFYNEQEMDLYWGRAILSALILLVGFIFLMGSFTIIGAGERGVVTRLGAVQDTILDEGIHLKMPILDSVHKMDVSIQKAERAADSASKDLQSITTTVAVNYHLNPLFANKVYQEFRRNYEGNVVEPAIQEAVKAATSQFTAEELITNRAAVRDEMISALKENVEPYGILVDGLSIVNFAFSNSFNVAIEAKVTAEQDALAAENKLKQVEFEAEQRIAQAKAEAEAIRIQAQAVTQQGGSDYVKLQWVEAWDGILPTTMLGDDSSVILGL